MKLLYPEFLYALFALIIPIIIHLFNFRRYKTVRFSQVRLLKSVQQESQKQKKLKHWLVLISRCLAISALVIAFSQPYYQTANQEIEEGKKGVSIYIDNSFSMQAKAESGQLLDLAKNRALSIVSAFRISDRFQLICNDFTSSQQKWMDRDAFIDALQQIQLSPKRRALSEVINRQNSLFEKNQDLKAVRYYISDLQKSFFDWPELNDSISINLIPLEAERVSNLSLDSLAFNKPYRSIDFTEELNFKVINHSPDPVEQIAANLKLNQELRAPSLLSVKGMDSISQKLSFSNTSDNWQKGELYIQDFPVNFDDTLYFSYPLLKNINVLHLYEKQASQSIDKLFKEDSFIVYRQQAISQIDFSLFGSSQFIILDGVTEISSGLREELKQFVKGNHSIAIFPTPEMNVQSVNTLLLELGIDPFKTLKNEKVELNQLNTNAEIYQGVFESLPQSIDLPKASQYWEISSQNQSKRETLLGMNNGLSALNAYELESGKIYLSALQLDSSSNFTAHAIFVPTLYNMAVQSQSTPSPLHFMDESLIRLKGVGTEESPITIKGNSIELIPKQRKQGNDILLELNPKIIQAGHYELLRRDSTLAWVSLNYSRNESNMECYSVSEIEDLFNRSALDLSLYTSESEVLSNEIEESSRGKSLWKYFIVIALLFLAMEILLLRLMK